MTTPVDLITEIKLGDSIFPVAQTSLNQARIVWPQWRKLRDAKGDSPEEVDGMLALIFQACKAADPTLPPNAFDKVKGVNPLDLFSWFMKYNLARLFGFEFEKEADTKGEAEAGEKPAT